MIPVKLSLKNFMCYRDPPDPLVLDGIHIACISGDNGHGKSALLDAITWALWGKARGKGADELVHLGQQDMEVDLEFTLGGQLYRVLRKHSRGKAGRSGRTLLELQVAENGAGKVSFRAITANTVRETDRKIVDLLRMDYETFVNSAFLRQGRADEFTVRTAKERKEVLAEILNLSLYDELEAKARKKARELEIGIAVLEKELADINEELKKRPDIEEEISQVKVRLIETERDEALHRVEVEKLAGRRDALETKRSELEQIGKRLAQAEEEMGQLKAEMEGYQRRTQQYDEIIANQDEVKAGYARYQKASKDKDELDRKLSRVNALLQQQGLLGREIDTERFRLEGEAREVRAQLGGLQPRIGNIEAWEKEGAECSKKLMGLEEVESSLKRDREKLEELSSSIHHLDTSNRQLKQEMEGLREKIDMLKEGVAECPLCRSRLGEVGLDHIRRAYEEEGLKRKDAYLENQARLKSLSAEQDGSRKELVERESRLAKERRSLERRASVLEQKLKEGKAGLEEAASLHVRLEAVEVRLSDKDFKFEAQGRLAEVESELAALHYDADSHQSLIEALSELKRYDTLYRGLEEARLRLPEVQQALGRARAREGGLKARAEEERRRKESAEKDLADLPRLEQDLSEARRVHRELAEEDRRWRDRYGALQETLRRISEREEAAAAKREALKRSTRDQGLYEELGHAFGKAGVQALIIETVLPEIEEEANRLLGLMTANRMHVKMETQREKKTGGLLETLDINIADELGTRPYELFSGGEAFRINFALRIALSKLLAHRAGAPLPTLFIDEGFGTQDGTGREKLLETINAIGSDFQRIIVITHIEDLREAFPVRIQVTKTDEGSRYLLN